MNYLDVLKILYYERPHGKVKIELGLRRMERLLALLGDPHRSFKAIHIAGTNGKGSTTRLLYDYLVECGYRTGAFFSPHLSTFRERILFNGRHISEDEVVEIFQDVYPAVKKMDSFGEEWRPSFFETLTAMVFTYFSKMKVEWGVIEVGLGGRLDATNVIIPEASIITMVHYDHMKTLGNTLDKIAWEQSGIIKEKKPTITGEVKRIPLNVIMNVANERNSPVYALDRDFAFCDVQLKLNENSFTYRGDNVVENVLLAMNGRHQVQNASVAIKALEILGLFDEEKLKNSFKRSVNPGRFEVFNYDDKLVVLDGAHNEAGAVVLAQTIEDYFPDSEIVGVIGILDDKNREVIVDKLKHFFGKVYVSRPKSPRANKFYEVCDMFREHRVPCEIIEDGWKAFKKAVKDPSDVVLVAGSLYLLGEIRMMIVNGQILPEWNI